MREVTDACGAGSHARRSHMPTASWMSTAKRQLCMAARWRISDRELDKLAESIRSIREGHFLRALVREELKQDANWVVKLRETSANTRNLLSP